MNDLITEIRKERGLSQAEFARLIGLSEAMVSRLESGERNPGRQTLAGLLSIADEEQKGLIEDAILETAGVTVHRPTHSEEQMSENILVDGDLHQAQEEIWHGNVSITIEEFLGELSIEQGVDEFIAAYPEHWEPMPVYELKMTGSTYTLREMLIGYLERMTDD